MKLRVMPILFCVAATTNLVVAQRGVMRDAATHEQLSELSRKAIQEDPAKSMVPTKGPDPSTANRPKDLLSESETICFNGSVALVPKQAVLRVPENLKDRLKYQKGAKLMSWSDFFAVNRGWITTQEVSRTQAEGNAPIADEIQRQISKTGNLVIATYQGGPISVLPLKAPPTTTPAQLSKP